MIASSVARLRRAQLIAGGAGPSQGPAVYNSPVGAGEGEAGGLVFFERPCVVAWCCAGCFECFLRPARACAAVAAKAVEVGSAKPSERRIPVAAVTMMRVMLVVRMLGRPVFHTETVPAKAFNKLSLVVLRGNIVRHLTPATPDG